MGKSALLRSHDDLGAALRIAGTEIRKLNFGKANSGVLRLLKEKTRNGI